MLTKTCQTYLPGFNAEVTPAVKAIPTCPTAETIEDFFPKRNDDIDLIEEVYETCPPEVYAEAFFAQCQKAIGHHAVKEGLDFTALSSGAVRETRSLLGARDAETGEITL